MLDLQVKSFDEISKQELYTLLKLRMKVFMLEQKSLYLDMDNCDQTAYHFLAKNAEHLAAYSRVILDENEMSAYIGRLVVDENYRNKSIGSLLIGKMIEFIKSKSKSKVIYLNSQVSAQRIYKKFGFSSIGDQFDDSGILHIKMQKNLEEF